ncbi:Asp23/Gls24 family envelope stress response protein [Amycolatopsis sp. H20-H5]|uniref:Asp23/Gls24 family envelope stress response protein n=1 Tax=Amycolatopsis sp. H20-H5 TaxID=3046309 RepID=UPI002DB650CC|nr:Asp23/Gls24 family envelope stress response protein [Amycolatopsis sp. H20-H5]MEC3976167.1 Asp23/Gls24 family envelope stress response protein [Amycolatopsis sp. H20-H5]
MAVNQTTNQTTQSYALPCGRDVETVWERLGEVEAGRADAHDIDCRHCRAARESLKVLRDLTGELAADDSEPSLDLTGRIMSAVRAEVRRHDLVPLPTAEPGGVRVSEQAVASVLRFAADTVDGVHARHCKVTAVDGFAVEVRMSLAVSYRGFTGHALEDVRERVTAAAGARLGVRLARLDLTLADLYDA